MFPFDDDFLNTVIKYIYIISTTVAILCGAVAVLIYNKIRSK